MTVAELIAELQRFPQDAVVLYRCCSDFSDLDPGDVRVATVESEEVCIRRGLYCDATHYRGRWGDEKPVFVQAVVFPGN